MAGNNILPQQQDVVGVFAADFSQVFPDARPTKLTLRRIARPMEHPVETGVTITDHRIIMPMVATLQVIVPNAAYKNTYREIVQLFSNSELLSIMTKVGYWPNFFITEMPHEESPEIFDAVTISLSLKEVLYANSSPVVVPADPTNNPTIKRGLIRLEDVKVWVLPAGAYQ